MDSNDNTQCDLKLKKMVFDKILFERFGFKNEEHLEIDMNVQIGENTEDNIYKVTLLVSGDKKDEYKFQVKLSGFFSVNGDGKGLKDILLTQNAVAIMMPYIRSEISLITAQPDTECVVLPPFNIGKMIVEV